MINKIYMFQFVNTYISNFVYIFYYQDYNKLLINLVTVMVFKQIVFVLAEYLWLKASVRRQINIVNNLFKERIENIENGEADNIDKNDQLVMAEIRLH